MIEMTLSSLLHYGATVILVPATGWLINNSIAVIRKQTAIELNLHDVSSDVKTLKADRTVHNDRISKVEDAIVGIKEADKRADVMFAEIKTSLTQLTRISTLVENLASASSQIVPRPEIENRLHDAIDRIKSLEQTK